MSTVLVIYLLLCGLIVPVYGAVKLAKYISFKKELKEIHLDNEQVPLEEILKDFQIGGDKKCK